MAIKAQMALVTQALQIQVVGVAAALMLAVVVTAALESSLFVTHNSFLRQLW
jgi:hypothetical protein